MPGDITQQTLTEITTLSGQPFDPGRIGSVLTNLNALRNDLASLQSLDIEEIEPANTFVAGRDDDNG
jgi:hypothetical protein